MNPEALSTASMRSLAVAPARVLSGPGALDALARLAADTARQALVITGDRSWAAAEAFVAPALGRAGLAFDIQRYGTQVTEEQIERLCATARGSDAIIGVGGGKALDAAKLVAHLVGVPVFTIPTSPATCAAWTALSNVYDDRGGWRHGVALSGAPRAIAVDYDLLATVPARLLASGVADAMAKWYESDSVVDPTEADAMALAAMEVAHHLHKQLVRHAKRAMVDLGRGRVSDAVIRVLDLNLLLAGAVGGMGGQQCRSVAAHAVANGLTHLPGSELSYHGELVAFGILAQLILLDRALDEIEELIGFFVDLGLPITLERLLGRGSAVDLGPALEVALHPSSTIHRLGIPLDDVTLGRAILEADALARRRMQQLRLENALRPIDLSPST